MKLKKLPATLIIAAAVAATNAQAPAQTPLVSSLSNQDKAPAVSSPQETTHENGDRVSHYPPYYHPEKSGHRR